MFALALRNDGCPVDVGGLVDQALRRIDMSHKEAWLVSGYGDGAQWSRAIHGEASLDLWRLARLPWRFWSAFVPLFVAAITQNWLSEMKADRMVKADLRTETKKEKVS